MMSGSGRLSLNTTYSTVGTALNDFSAAISLMQLQERLQTYASADSTAYFKRHPVKKRIVLASAESPTICTATL